MFINIRYALKSRIKYGTAFSAVLQAPCREPNYCEYRTKIRGFSLIELMVVVVIIGIMSGATLFAFGDFGTARKTKAAAEQLAQTIKLVQQRAILEGSPFGLLIHSTGYDIYHLDQYAHWTPVPVDHLFHGQKLPSRIIIQNHRRQHPQTVSKKIIPDILITASGEISRFQLFLGSETKPETIELFENNHGEIAYKTV